MRFFFLFFAVFTLSAQTVVIDAGHGGNDRGTRSKMPFCEEKRLCLYTSRLVRQYLDQLGYHVIMTRDNDTFVPLPRRVEIAQQASSSIFVSILFCDSKEQKQKTSASKRLAEAILPRVIRRTAANSRGVKRANFFVIRETKMPAVLIEGGFISNPLELSQLKTREYQEKIARGIADGIDSYFKRKTFARLR